MCENYSLQMSPVGTAENDPGRQSWVNWTTRERYGNHPRPTDLSWGWLPRVANGPFQSWRYPKIASWGIFSRPCGTGSLLEPLPRTHVLGYSQPSLRDSFGESSSHTPSKAPVSLRRTSFLPMPNAILLVPRHRSLPPERNHEGVRGESRSAG